MVPTLYGRDEELYASVIDPNLIKEMGICKTFPEYASDLIDNKSDAFYRK